MTTQYLSYGIVDGRTHSDRDLDVLRTMEAAREHHRRARWARLLPGR